MTEQSPKQTSRPAITLPVMGNDATAASPRRSGPAGSRHRLGTRLRQLRHDQGLLLEDVAARLGISPSTLSRVETGKAAARTLHVGALLDLYGVGNPAERRQLADLAHRSRNNDSHAPHGDLLPVGARQYLTLEAEAVTISIFATQAIPLLLATPAYAAAACRATRPHPTPGQVRDLGALNTRRQELADRTGLTLHVVLDEAALHRPVASPHSQAGQLAHLAERATNARTTVQVLSLATAWPVLTTPFSLLAFTDSVAPAGCTVTATGQHLITRRDIDIQVMKNAFTSLSQAALSAEESERLIADLAAKAAR